MKVVLDTSVLVPGLLTPRGHCSQILELVLEGFLAPCVDGRVLAEYEAVLGHPRLGIAARDAEEIMSLLRRVSQPVAPVPLPVRLPDAHDLPFLEVAAAAEAILVTGNARHFPTEKRRGVAVLTPAGLLDHIRRSQR